MLIHDVDNPRVLRNFAQSTWHVLYKWNNVAWVMAPLSTVLLTEHFMPTLETSRSDYKKIPLRILPSSGHAPGHARALMETRNEEIVWLAANAAPVPQGMDQGIILTFGSYHLRNTFCKATAAAESDSSDGGSQGVCTAKTLVLFTPSKRF